MPEESMLGISLRDFSGPMKDLLDKVDGEDGETWLRALKLFLRKDIWFPKPKLLRLIDVVETQRVVTTFEARSFFRETDQPDGIKMVIGDGFKKHFLKGSGKLERDVRAGKVKKYELRQSGGYSSMLAELRSEGELITVALAQIADLLKSQSCGKFNCFSESPFANDFFSEDISGELCLVTLFQRTSWSHWEIDALANDNGNYFECGGNSDKMVFSGWR